MRTLVLTRGSAGSGKSTWIKEHGLEQYTLSPDLIRTLVQSPVLTEDGTLGISQKNNTYVFKLLTELLEERMKRGDFTVIDATHTRSDSFNNYKKLAQKYRYRVLVVDFSDVPIEKAKRQNRYRSGYKQVPEHVIDRMYSELEEQKIPSFAKLITREEFEDEIQFLPLDFSNWKKIHHIGDIHGCFDALMEYFSFGKTGHIFDYNETNDQHYPMLNDDELYVFCGDYVDRGIQNAEVMKFLFTIMELPNVILLEGNHEIHLWNWANGDAIHSKEFKQNTQKQLEENGVSKKDARIFYRKLRQVAYYVYNGKLVLVTHGGLSGIPSNLSLIATEQFIKGVGKYETEIDQIFVDNTFDYQYQIHGHRNIQRHSVQVNERTFNLEGQVEFGKHLRAVTLSKDGFETVEIKNEVYNEAFRKQEPDTPNDLLTALRDNPNIIERVQLGTNISSFNFNKKVFYDKLWNAQTTKARGLFINTKTGEIVARSYDKFFNINERPETTINALANTMMFPVDVYLKENGFLGILGYDGETDRFVVASKSSMDGDFAVMFDLIISDKIRSDEMREDLKNLLSYENLTLTFEVIDPVEDPHIIEYDKPRVILLDAVKRTEQYEKLPYEKVVEIAQRFGLEVKERIMTLDNWESFYAFYTGIIKNENMRYEGFVIEDSLGFMTKIKLPYYSFWKEMRGLKERMCLDGATINKRKFNTPLAVQFYEWLDSKDVNQYRNLDIITLRKQFEKEMEMK